MVDVKGVTPSGSHRDFDLEAMPLAADILWGTRKLLVDTSQLPILRSHG
jgi:hypothetical protein